MTSHRLTELRPLLTLPVKRNVRRKTTVDRASTYVDWARDNLELNRLWGPQHRLVRADSEDFLARARAEGRRWDLVFVDPPSFSNRRNSSSQASTRSRSGIERSKGANDGWTLPSSPGTQARTGPPLLSQVANSP